MRSGIACLMSFFYILVLIVVAGCVATEDTAAEETPVISEVAETHPLINRAEFFTFVNLDEALIPDIIEHNGMLLAVIGVEEEEPPICYADACYLQWVGVFTGSFSRPLSSAPTYNCNYGSGSIYYSTLYGDNQDGGATCSATSGYSGSLCDSYDSLTGSSCEGQFCGRHAGVDIAVGSGTSVYAIASGTISSLSTSCSGGWGCYVLLRHTVSDSVTGTCHYIYSLYAHLTSVTTGLASGSSVSKGARIGRSGNTGTSTGPHLHFQLERDGTYTSGSSFSHPYASWSSRVNTPDWDGSEVWEYTYNPMSTIGYGSCY